jgi:signal transduction histidine kinase
MSEGEVVDIATRAERQPPQSTPAMEVRERRQLRDALLVLADEQAALRRVATLVAGGAAADVVFATVLTELTQVLAVSSGRMLRYEPDRSCVVVASLNDPGFPVGSRWPLDGPSLAAAVLDTGSPARIDDYTGLPGTIAASQRAAGLGPALGVPITVDGSVWGLICVSNTEYEPLPVDIERRLAGFTELVATAIANSQARDELRRLTTEQEALRRVATLVAAGAGTDEVFDAVAAEVTAALDVSAVMLDRFDPDETFTVVAAQGQCGFTVGSRWPLERDSLASSVYVYRRPGRIDDWSKPEGVLAAAVRASAIASTVACPILVDSQVWGRISASSDSTLPPDTEARLTRFAELVAIAISNAGARADLLASRARIVAAADEARRKIERDLHDGIQQQLIVLRLEVEAICAAIPRRRRGVHERLEQLQRDLDAAFVDVRDISRGLYPPLLKAAGLGPALEALSRRSRIPVDLYLAVPERLPKSIEIAVYYVVSEALTNAAKHSRGTQLVVSVTTTETALHASIQDNGVGGAQLTKGSGLTGLADRVEAIGGQLTLDSPLDHGTQIAIELPIRA